MTNLNKTPKIFITSDLHFCHDRAFVYEPRGFSNIKEMNQAIVERWNSTVQPEDIVYVLGDIMLNNNDDINVLSLEIMILLHDKLFIKSVKKSRVLNLRLC